MTQFHNYSPDLIIISFGHVDIAGFADGTFVTIARDEDAYTKKTGATGDVVRVRNLNKGGSVKFVLQQASISNDQLMALYAADQAFASFATQDIQIKDLNGTTLVHAGNAWIKKLPSIEFGKELTNREWTIDCDNIEIFVGGSLS